MAYTYRHGDRPLEGYTIQRAVGRGGFGEVYYAVSDGGREVALKYLRENPNIELRGISYCMNLKSPHLVSIFDVKANAQGEYFVVMEYVSGPSLRDLLLAEPNGVGPQKAAYFIREIAKGLAYLHDRGIVHRDLKPGNIFYDEGYVKIGDYGLSKFISVSRHSAQTASIGTVHYMAPEVGSGNYHRGIDIYALGVMLYEMLLGRVPFDGASMGEVLMKHLSAQPEVDQLPAPFAQVIRKALAKDPAERYQTIYEMVDDLLEVEDVQHSLAGFNPASLAAIEPRGTADKSDSPAPSPNPAPRRLPVPNPPGFDLDARPLPAKVAQRIAAIGERVDKRVHRLDARHGPRTPRPPVAPPVRPQPGKHANSARSRGELVQRLLLALVMAIALGVGLGFLVDAKENGMASAIMLVVGMPGALALGVRLCARASRHHPQPRWIERICHTAPVAVIGGLGVLPFAEGYADAALGVWGALLVVAFLANWQAHTETGARGSISIRHAVTVAIIALIASAIFSNHSHGGDNGMALATGVAAASSVVLQALAWLFPILHRAGGGGTPSAPREEPRPQPPHQRRADTYSGPATPYHAAPAAPPGWSAAPSAAPSAYGEAPSFVIAGPPPRSWLVRLLAGLVFLVALGLTVGFSATLIFRDTEPVVRTVRAFADGRIVSHSFVDYSWKIPFAAVAAGSFGLILAAGRKMRRYPTGGFYRETLRPLLMTVVLAGLAGLGTALSLVGPNNHPSWAMLVLLILLAMMFLFLLVKRGRRYEAASAIMSTSQPHFDSEAVAARQATPTTP